MSVSTVTKSNVISRKRQCVCMSFTLSTHMPHSIAAFTMFIGISFPFFGGLLGFFGGFAFSPTTYFVSPPRQPLICIQLFKIFLVTPTLNSWSLCPLDLILQLPCIMWLAIKKPRKFGLSWTVNWVRIHSTSITYLL